MQVYRHADLLPLIVLRINKFIINFIYVINHVNVEKNFYMSSSANCRWTLLAYGYVYVTSHDKRAWRAAVALLVHTCVCTKLCMRALPAVMAAAPHPLPLGGWGFFAGRTREQRNIYNSWSYSSNSRSTRVGAVGRYIISKSRLQGLMHVAVVVSASLAL